MMLKKIMIAGALCLSAHVAGAQNGSFLNTPSDARSVAMGGAGYAIQTAAFPSGTNTAGMLSSGCRGAAGVSYVNWQPELLGEETWNFGGYYLATPRLGITAGIRLNTLDSYMRMDSHGNTLEEFAPEQQAYELGAAYGITHRFAVGATVRYMRSKIGWGDTAGAFGADIHLFYNLDQLRLGLGVTNLGSKFDYGYSENDLPARLKAGAAYRFEPAVRHALTVAGQLDYQMMPKDFTGVAAGLGLEYMYNNLVALRAGYHFEDKDKTGESYGSVGCGINLYGASLDFGYLFAGSDSFIKNSLLVSLAYRFR